MKNRITIEAEAMFKDQYIVTAGANADELPISNASTLQMAHEIANAIIKDENPTSVYIWTKEGYPGGDWLWKWGKQQ